MASDSEMILETSSAETKGSPEDQKPKRRSSIFRPEDAEPTHPNNKTLKLSAKYIDKLAQGNIKWKGAYGALKAEILELTKHVRNTPGETLSTDLSSYDQYLRKTEEFCNQINNVTEMHKNISNYRNIRKEALTQILKSTEKQIHRNLQIGTF